RRPQGRQQGAPVAGALGAQLREQRASPLHVLSTEHGRLSVEMREQHVEVAHLAEDTAQLLQPLVELGGVGRDELASCAEQGTQATNAYAHVVEALGVATETCARIVPLDLAKLVAQPASQLLEETRRRIVYGRPAERPKQFRQAGPLLGAGRDELARNLVEPVRAAVAELDLDLDEVVARLARVQHRDLVRSHLGRRPVARDELAAAMRPKLGYALERPT